MVKKVGLIKCYPTAQYGCGCEALISEEETGDVGGLIHYLPQESYTILAQVSQGICSYFLLLRRLTMSHPPPIRKGGYHIKGVL